jgi:hypothetical protein
MAEQAPKHWRINMRRIALTALGFALLLSAVQLYSQTNAAAEKVLQNKEQAGWQAWKDHDPKSVEGITPENAVSISDGTVAKGKQQILKSMVDPGCVANSFSLSDFSYLWLDNNTTAMAFHQETTAEGM